MTAPTAPPVWGALDKWRREVRGVPASRYDWGDIVMRLAVLEASARDAHRNDLPSHVADLRLRYDRLLADARRDALQVAA